MKTITKAILAAAIITAIFSVIILYLTKDIPDMIRCSIVSFVCLSFLLSVTTDKRNRPVSIQDINEFNAKEMGIFQACLLENKKSHASTFVTYQQFNDAVDERQKLLADVKIFQSQINALKEREARMYDDPPPAADCVQQDK